MEKGRKDKHNFSVVTAITMVNFFQTWQLAVLEVCGGGGRGSLLLLSEGERVGEKFNKGQW